MKSTILKWTDRRLREEQLDEAIERKKRARFGSEELAESEKADRVRRHFDSVARKYDLMNTLLSMGVHYFWKRLAVGRMGLKPGDRVLDVCGGTGDLSIMAARKTGTDGGVAVYDINREMLRAGKTKETNRKLRERLLWIQGDAERISFPDDSFDAVMIGFAVRNITHMKQAFREMHRVLKPGGRFMCLEFSRPVWPWFRWVYDLYSFIIMPWLGGLITGSRLAYVCLPETIRLFLLPDEISDVFREIGFTDITYDRMTNGIAVMHLAVKPEAVK